MKLETLFQVQLDMLFDIANDALTMCKVDKEREFLIDQRTERYMIISSEDKKYNKKQGRIQQRKSKDQNRLEK